MQYQFDPDNKFIYTINETGKYHSFNGNPAMWYIDGTKIYKTNGVLDKIEKDNEIKQFEFKNGYLQGVIDIHNTKTDYINSIRYDTLKYDKGKIHGIQKAFIGDKWVNEIWIDGKKIEYESLPVIINRNEDEILIFGYKLNHNNPKDYYLEFDTDRELTMLSIKKDNDIWYFAQNKQYIISINIEELIGKIIAIIPKIIMELQLFYTYQFQNKAELKKSVDEWCNNKEDALNKYGHINSWDTSKITDMRNLFTGKKQFNDCIDNWDVSNVTDMYELFYGAESFNQPLNNWNVSHVKEMFRVFEGAIKFNQPLNNWDVSNVVNLCAAFSHCRSFNQDISNWDTSNVTDMSWLFYNCDPFNQDISNWNVLKVTNISMIFIGAPKMEEKNKPKFK